MNTPILNGLENLEQWFKANELPFFTLYFGNPPSKNASRNVAFTNTEIEDLEAAWKLLEDFLKLYPLGSRFKLLAKKEALATTGAYVLFSTGVSPQGAIGNLPGQATNLAPSMGYVHVSEVNKRIEEALEKKELHDRINQLENQANAPSNLFDKCVETINSLGLDVNGIITVLLMRLNVIPGQALQSAPPINGTPTTESPSLDTGHSIDTEEEDPISLAINRVIDIYGEDETAQALTKLANFVEKNPQQAKLMLNAI